MKSNRIRLFLITTVFLSLTAFLILTFSNMAYREDMVGHLFKAKNQSLTHYLQGWNLYHWAGYSDDLYPNGYHYFLKLFLTFLPDQTAVKLTTWFIFLFQTIALIILSKRLFPTRPKQQQLNLLIALFALTLIPSHMLGGISGTILAGAGPAGLGMAFFILATGLIIHPKPKLNHTLTLGLTTGLAILTHTISAVAIGTLFVIHAFFSSHKKHLLFSFLLGSIIGLPFIWIFLSPVFHGSRLNLAGDFRYSLITLTLAGILFFISPKKQLAPVIVAIFFLLLASLPLPVSDWLWTHGLAGFHFYRFYPYALLLLIFSAVPHLQTKKFSFSIFILLTFSLGSALYLQNVKQVRVEINFNDNVSRLFGRSLDTSPHAKTFTMPHTISTLLPRLNPNLITSQNLFFESSQLGILYYSLETLVSPNGYLSGLDSRVLRKNYNLPIYELNASDAADLLGVNYYLVTAIKPVADEAIIPLGQITQKVSHQDPISLYFYAQPASSTQLVQPLNYLPQPSAQDFTSWWPNASLDNLYRMPADQDNEFDRIKLKPGPATITDLDINRSSFSYTVNSEDFVPVLAKFTYNRYFSAISNGQPVPIAQVSPGLMLIPSRGNMTVSWHYPQILLFWEKVSQLILLTTTISLFFLKLMPSEKTG